MHVYILHQPLGQVIKTKSFYHKKRSDQKQTSLFDIFDKGLKFNITSRHDYSFELNKKTWRRYLKNNCNSKSWQIVLLIKHNYLLLSSQSLLGLPPFINYNFVSATTSDKDHAKSDLICCCCKVQLWPWDWFCSWKKDICEENKFNTK